MSDDSLNDAMALPQQTSRQQCAGSVLMVRPAAFAYNPQTAATNKMQRPPEYAVEKGPVAQISALQEFDRLAGALRSEGVAVCVAEDTADPVKPDAVFPNNWISFHEDGTVVLYPMQAQNRRLERRAEIVDTVAQRLGFEWTRLVDLTHHEAEGRYLEGTGSLVLDHLSRTAYACLSERTHPAVLEEWCGELGYEVVVFDAFDKGGAPLYHTNVLMCVGRQFAVVGTAAMPLPDRERVLARLAVTGREIIEIGQSQIEGFAGNMLELASWDEALGDCSIIVMSDAARHALSPQAYARLSACTDCVLAVPVPTIERLGGGSVRCMLAEVFLPV